MRRFALLLLVAFSGFSQTVQFSGLAASDDGAQFYFSSPLALRGTDQYGHAKIFRLVPEGLELFRQVEALDRGVLYSNYYMLESPDVSGDGRTVSYVARRICHGGSSCLYVEVYQTTITGPGAALPMTFTGQAKLSRDGRYAVRFGARGLEMTPGDNGPHLIELSTGERTLIRARILPGRPLARGGLVAAWDDGHLVLWTKTGERRIPLAQPPWHVVLSDDAGWVAWQSQTGDGPARLFLLDVARGTQAELASAAPGMYGVSPFSPSFSNDGRWLLYLASPADSQTPQAFLRRTGSAEERQLTNAEEGVREAVLSGFGNVAYAATYSGRLLRIEIAGGTVTEISSRTPLVTDVAGAPAPGSLNWLRGFGLSDQTATAATPLQDFLGGVQVRLGARAVPLLSVSPEEVVYQIPFETAPGAYSIGPASTGSPFEFRKQIEIREQAPQAIEYGREVQLEGAFGPVIVDAGFKSVIGYENKARPGDVVHVYMTGLGKVHPRVESGYPAPLDQLAWADPPLACNYYDVPGHSVPAEILFAGLAPGMVGIYQLDIRVPRTVQPLETDPTRGIVTYQCGEGQDGGGYFSVHVALR